MKPDPRVLRTLDTLATWLESHASKLDLPPTQPVAAADVARAEQLLGSALPADYLTFLDPSGDPRSARTGAHAQPPSFVQGLEMLSLKSALSDYQGMVEDWDEEGPGDMETTGPVRALYKHERWLPIVLIFGASEFLCLDLDPAPGGTSGQIIWVSDDDYHRRVVAPSFAVFLERLVAALHSPGLSFEDGEARLPDPLFDQLLGR